MATTQNVLILSSNTGGGHRSAANALSHSLMSLNPDKVLVKITQVLEEASAASKHFADVYNYLLRHHQGWMQYYYWFVNHMKPNESKLILKSTLKYGLRLFEKFTPDVIVSVHPMTQHFISYVLKKVGLQGKIPLVSVVTDPCYGFWRGWACDEVRQYYVASDDARRQLVDYGVDPSIIQVRGMPVHSRFVPPTELQKQQYRKEFGLSPELFTVFLNAGWIGGGNIPKIYEELAKADLPIQAVFLAGHNPKLIDRAKRLTNSAPFPTHVMGYCDEIEKLMAASNVMVSKLGGLTTFEALSCQLPIIADVVTPPMPQEKETNRYLQDSGAGLMLDHPDKIVSLIKSLLDSPSQYDMMRQAALNCVKPGASDHIAREILGHIHQ